MNHFTPIVLIVDDIVANRATLIEMLDSGGYEIAEADDGPTALLIAAKSPPDLVLLDVMMPGMNGFEVCRRIRAAASTAEVPIIMVTALDDQASRLTGIEAGADDFITKPFNAIELRARVRTITRLNRFRRMAELRQRFEWIVEQAGEGYVLVNAADEILYANPCARRWLSLPPKRGDGTGDGTFLAAVNRGNTFVVQPAELWRNWPNIPAETLALPRLLVRSETSQARAFFLEVSICEHSSGRLLRLCDVTHRLAERLDQRSFQLMVSHKLRTPLNGIVAPMELLAMQECVDDGDELSGLAAVVRDSTTRLVNAVVDVVKFTELSKCPAVGEGFALSEFAGLVQRVSNQLDLPHVMVAVPEDAQSARLACAPDAMEWVIFELLENAKKFHPQRTPEVQVMASLHCPGRMSLTVSDDGLTLPPEQLRRAGTPYFQGERDFTGEIPGMGLGLASVFTLVWQVGGSCCLSNQPIGPGVCVELQWPLVTEQKDYA